MRIVSWVSIGPWLLKIQFNPNGDIEMFPQKSHFQTIASSSSPLFLIRAQLKHHDQFLSTSFTNVDRFREGQQQQLTTKFHEEIKKTWVYSVVKKDGWEGIRHHFSSTWRDAAQKKVIVYHSRTKITLSIYRKADATWLWGRKSTILRTVLQWNQMLKQVGSSSSLNLLTQPG